MLQALLFLEISITFSMIPLQIVIFTEFVIEIGVWTDS